MLNDLYPFGTVDGKAIPLDIIRPIGLIVTDFTLGGISAAESLPAEVPVVIFRATEDCVVAFNEDAYLPASGDGFIPSLLLLEAGVSYVVAPAESNFTVSGITANGTLYTQVIQKWAGLSLNSQTNGRRN